MKDIYEFSFLISLYKLFFKNRSTFSETFIYSFKGFRKMERKNFKKSLDKQILSRTIL